MKQTKKIFDGLLVLEYRNGNEKAISMLVERYHMDFYRYATWYTKDAEAALDIVQESWATILKKLHTLRDPNSFKSWALRIVLRKAQDHLKSGAKSFILDAEINPGPQIESDIEEEEADKKLRLRKAIQSLSTDQQLVVRLFYTEQYSLREISSVLAISTGTVKSRLYHAREKLKSILNNKSHEKRNGKN